MSDLDRLEKQLKEVHESQLFVEMDKRDAADLIARVKAAEAEAKAVFRASYGLSQERDAYKARLDAVRATVEYEKHWNDGYGWDVATIRVFAALDGDPTG